MATYCIGDLHGRYDLFMLLMKKINFSCDIDHLYLLGDIIGGHKDDIKLLNFVVNNQNCISLILGNHENIILGNRRLLDIIMSSEGLHNAFLKICATYIKPFEEIEDSLFKLITPKNKQKVYTKKIQKWLSNGNVKRRKQLFDAFLELLNELEYDRNAFAQIQYIFVLFRHNIVKNILTRILELHLEEYEKIIAFLEKVPRCLKIELNDRKFELLHSIHDILPNKYKGIYFPHSEQHNTYYVFGHIPTPKINKDCTGLNTKFENTQYNKFRYNYLRMLGYIDINNNRYYNIDTGSNPIMALRLDDLSQFYAGLPSEKAVWSTPDDTFGAINDHTVVEEAIFHLRDEQSLLDEYVKFDTASESKFAFLTVRDSCFEYLIGVDLSKGKIYYTRIDWFDYAFAFTIDNCSNNQALDDIVHKVNTDFLTISQTPIMKLRNDILLGK